MFGPGPAPRHQAQSCLKKEGGAVPELCIPLQVHRFPWADFKGFGTLQEAEQFLLSGRSSAAEQPPSQQARNDKSDEGRLNWTTAAVSQQGVAAQTASSTDEVIVTDSDSETKAAGPETVNRKRKLESGLGGPVAAPLVEVDPSLVYRLVSALGTCSALALPSSQSWRIQAGCIEQHLAMA